VASQTIRSANTAPASLGFNAGHHGACGAITSRAARQTGPDPITARSTSRRRRHRHILDGRTAVGSASSRQRAESSVTLNQCSNSLTAKVSVFAANPAPATPVVYTLSTTGPTLTENLAFGHRSFGPDHITANDALSGTGWQHRWVHLQSTAARRPPP